ncbi:IclR family transcriptional regulator [Halomicroarcula sp. GCM10025324]|uniref:IclR family transcriptional regulator n=1 Tax=Haloarcula TaxID=2237 RepID=UPI0023E8D010|nr:helix-turn-helix domain-containing protein [Halomicroarcula sp. ZS-22-S1]
MANSERQSVRAVDTMFSILETVQQREVAGVTELARELDKSKSNVYKHMITLCEHGLVVRDGNKFRLGLRPFEMGSLARRRHPLYREAAANVQELADVTNESAALLVPNQRMGIYIQSINPDDRSTPGSVEGTRCRLHETASGQAILACYGPEKREKLLPETLADNEQQTLTENVDRIDKDGITVATLPWDSDLCEIAAPITVEEDPVGSIGLLIDSTNDSSDRIGPNYGQIVKKMGKTLSKRMHLRRGSEA